MQEEFIEPSWFIRFVVIPVFILWLVACEFYFIDELKNYIHTLPHCEKNQWLRGLYIALAICFALPSIEIARYAQRSFQSEQFPPPGMWVMRRTRVRHGAQAHKIAQTLTVVALLNLIIAGIAAYFISKTPPFDLRQREQCTADVAIYTGARQANMPQLFQSVPPPLLRQHGTERDHLPHHRGC